MTVEKMHWSLQKNVSEYLKQASENWILACQTSDKETRIQLLSDIRSKLEGIMDDCKSEIEELESL